MRENFDIEAAVGAGIIGEDQALALRNFEARRSGITAASAERFEFASGFADILAALGLGAILIAAVSLQMFLPLAGFVLIPTLVWAGRRLTIAKKMAASAHLLFFFFCVAVSGLGLSIAWQVRPDLYPPMQPVHLASPELTIAIAAITAAACLLWWRLVRLPVAVAACWVASLHAASLLVRLLLPDAEASWMTLIHFFWGAALLAAALWWDMTDVRRETVRSSVAFWCHVAAAFFLSHAALVTIAGNQSGASKWEALYLVQPGQLDPGRAPVYLAVFALFVVISLVIDRRSLLFASLYHAGIALLLLVGSLMPTLVLLGGALLLLALKWRELRTALLRRLPPAFVAQLPRTELVAQGRRPTRRHREMAPLRHFP